MNGSLAVLIPNWEKYSRQSIGNLVQHRVWAALEYFDV